MNFVIGATTTFTHKIPSFNVVYLDKDTLVPVEYQTWALDLDQANRDDNPIWSLRYNWTDTYNLPDMSPKSFL